jgi:hypothetical protein
MKKTKNNEGFLSKLISEVIREKLIEFLINFEFTFSIIQLIQATVITSTFFMSKK